MRACASSMPTGPVAVTAAAMLSMCVWLDTASAQCDVTPPAGAIQASDGCGQGTDSNGGCNVSPPSFTHLGSLGAGGSVNVVGQMGTFDTDGTPNSTESRDIDWMLVTTEVPGKLKLSLASRNALGQAQPESVIYIASQIDAFNPCSAALDLAIRSQSCPHRQELYVRAGTHLIGVTTPFDNPGSVVHKCGPYLLNVTLEPLQNAACGTSVESCTESHVDAGCRNIRCCELACSLDPSCCLSDWDASCVDLAITRCGLFAYSCQAPAGAPSNDCATSPQDIAVGQQGLVVANAGASTDGPLPSGTSCAAIGKDLWYRIQSPGRGRLTVSMCGSSAIGDSAMEAYRLGADPAVDANRAQSLPALLVGCADDTCGTQAGTESLTFAAEEGEYYLIRVGGWYAAGTGDPGSAATFAHNLDVSFERLLYTAGPQRRLVRPSTGALINVGISSGCVATAQPQRWLAVPWTAPTIAGVQSWRLSAITVKGFTPDPPQGSPPFTNTTLNYVIWSRSGSARPMDGDQRATGFVAFPTPYDDSSDEAANASHDLRVSLEVEPGDYYLTVYASNPSCGSLASNFAWYVMAPGGISLVDAGGPFLWRSATFPSVGFTRSTLSDYAVQAGDDPNDIYNCAFDIFASPVVADCPGDLDRDRHVDGIDLTFLLAGWGTPEADINGDGTTNGLDLTALLAAWGPCQ
jgi:hypothetical protein